MHFLKGSAANIGFVSFSKACQIAQHALLEEQEIDLETVFESYAASKLKFSSAFLKAQPKPVQIKN
jgi:HPt (histidine-containing phosphotransfer) domain-containing protein